MNRIMLLTLALVLSACGKPAPTDTVESLVAHPDHLRKVEQQCANSGANSGAKMLAAECNAASEARHRLFMGSGGQYTPPKTAPKF